MAMTCYFLYVRSDPSAHQTMLVAVQIQPSHAPQIDSGLGISLGIQLDDLKPVGRQVPRELTESIPEATMKENKKELSEMKEIPRILITGTHGFVGARAMERYPQAVAAESALLRTPGEGLKELIRKHQPEVIVNTAAISDIGTCARNPEGSYQANVILPVVLAEAAEEVGAKLISFSSDQVYTGCREEGPYSESLQLPEPTNLYARHKLEAEQRVLDIHPDGVLLRATWMYDMPKFDHANRGNFLVNTLGAVMQGKPICASSREYRGITYVRQVVEFLDQVFALPGGAYNYGSENSLTMLETAQALLDALGAKGQLQDMEGKGRNLWMDCSKLKENGIFFDTTAEGFCRCVKDYGLNW